MTGFISTNGALPNQVVGNISSDAAFSAPARSAAPSVSPTGYFIQAVCGGETINGTVTDGSYTISLVLGRTYTVTAGLKEGSITLMSDEWTNVKPTRANAASLTHNFLLKPVTGANGFVELPITISASSVHYVKVTCGNSAWGNTSGAASGSYTISKAKVTNPETGAVSGGVTPGIYEVTVSFYSGENGILLYSSTQSITVLANMTTNKWISGGGSADPIDSTGVFNVTAELISTFARTQIYVGSTKNPDGTVLGTASDNGTGSPYAPFATVENAIALIAATGSSTSDYNIWINGDVKGCTVITIPMEKARSITIQGYNGLNSNRKPNDSLNGENKDTVLRINTAVPIVIKNLKITGGLNSGRRTTDSASGNLTLTDGTLITGNHSLVGGGIYHGSGKIFMNGFACIGDSDVTAAAKNTTTASNYAETAGGIYVRLGAAFYMGYKDESNLSECTGGIFNNYASKTNFGDDESCGGGISASSATVKVASCSVSFNGAAKNGGGIASTFATIDITGGTFNGNWAGANVGAVYNKGILKISGSANIPYGGSVKSNDVFLDTGKVITVNGALTGTTPVATLTLSEWKRGTTVVEADGTNVTDLTLAQACRRFAITDPAWRINDSTGKLQAPNIIESADDLKNLIAPYNSDTSKSTENLYIVLDSDITLENYTPLGDFKGVFDGNGHTIKMKSVTKKGTTQLFSAVCIDNYGLIQNLTVELADGVTLNKVVQGSTTEIECVGPVCLRNN